MATRTKRVKVRALDLLKHIWSLEGFDVAPAAGVFPVLAEAVTDADLDVREHTLQVRASPRLAPRGALES